MHVQSCCFATAKPIAFLPSSLPSPSSLLKLPNVDARTKRGQKTRIFSCEIMKAFLSVTISLLQGDNIDVAGHDRLFFFILFYINTTFPMCSIKGGIKVITGPDGRTGHLGNEMGFFF